ncbi:MAG: hypothetical protein V4760_14185 [Bdellovibrionota bacterium]
MNSVFRRAVRPILLTSLGLSLMGAATDTVPPGAIAVTCLNHEAGICRLVSPTVGLTVTVKNGDANIQYFAPSAEGFVERAHTQVRPDLEARVGSGAMSPDEANVIFAEILANSFVAYRLPPNAETLNQDVGFAPNVLLSPQDQIEILRAHIQMSLTVNPVTARYLAEGLGLQVIEPVKPVNAEDPNLISESQELLATPSLEPAAVPAPVPADVSPAPAPAPAPLPPPIQTNPPTERITELRDAQTQS